MGVPLIRVLSVAATAILISTAAYFAYRSYQVADEPTDIRFVVTAWPTAELMHAVGRQGYFERRGISVSWIDVGERYEEAVRAITSGEADGGIFVLSEPLLMEANGTPVNVVLGVGYSAGADGIVAGPEISVMADLKGKRIAYQPGSFGDLLLRQALEQADVPFTDIVPVAYGADAVSRALLSGEVDAAVTFEPFLEQALRREGSHILFTSRQSPGLIPDVVVFRRDFVATHRREVAAFLSGWIQAMRELETNEQARIQAFALAAIASGRTIHDVERSLSAIKLYSFADNAVAFTYADDLTSLYKSGEAFLSFFERVVGLKSAVDVNRVIDPSFVRQGLRESF